MARWRAMVAADLAAVQAIAERLHPDHPERPEVFAERLALAPEGCLMLVALDGAPLGFALSHPWTTAAPPALDALLGTLPAHPDAWHIHDVALLEAARGQGHPATLLRHLAGVAAARGIARLTLVAVPGLDGYWARLGFVACAEGGATLAGYGAGARFMRRP